MLSRFRYLLLGSVFAASAICLGVACTAAPIKSNLVVRDSGAVDTSGNGDNTNPDTKLGESDPLQADGSKPPGRVYVHSPDTLFVYDPLAKGGAGSLTEVGAFDCLAGDKMIDIAVDRSNTMYGTTFAGFVKISPTDAKCQYIAKATGYPNSLAFMPIGTVDATKEALVGYGIDSQSNTTRFIRIATDTGAMTQIGSMNSEQTVSMGGTQYESSGDIIGLSRNGNRAYVTVKEIPNEAGATNTSSDSLAEIDPKTGAIKSVLGETGLQQLYGLGQWAGQAYAFSGTGAVVEIDLETGKATPMALDAGISNVAWYGAGVTTASPTKP